MGLRQSLRAKRRQLARNGEDVLTEQVSRNREHLVGRRRGRWREDSKSKLGGRVGKWVGRSERKQDAVFGQRHKKAGARRPQRHCQGGRGVRTRIVGGRRREKRGRRGGTRSFQGRGGGGGRSPEQAEQRQREQQGKGTAKRGALTEVPPHGAAGGLLPQVREEEVPGGLEVLEVAELDNGAGHGSEEPGSGTHLT